MDYISLVGIAGGLAMDAFAVSVTQGTSLREKKASQCLKDALRFGVCFGFFQGMMPFIGWAIGKVGESVIGQIDHWVAFLLLGWIGIQMIREAMSGEEEEASSHVDLKKLLTLGIATSIDALATGIILPGAVGASTVPLMLISVGMIGVITLVLSFAGVFIGRKFGELFAGKAEIVGGCVLIFIGARILIDHLFLS